MGEEKLHHRRQLPDDPCSLTHRSFSPPPYPVTALAHWTGSLLGRRESQFDRSLLNSGGHHRGKTEVSRGRSENFRPGFESLLHLDGFAFLLFPTMGGFLSDQLGFPSEMEIVDLILLINALVFTVSAGYDLRKELTN